MSSTSSSSTTTTSPQQPAALTGSCLCGKITYAVASGAKPILNVICHCANCKKVTGTHMFNSSVFPADAFAITSVPAAALKCYRDTNTTSGNVLERYFCGECGSPIYCVGSSEHAKQFISITAGTMDRGQGQEESVWEPNKVFYEEGRPAWLEKIKMVEQN